MKKIDKKKLLSELDKVTTKVAKKIKKDKNNKKVVQKVQVIIIKEAY